MICPWKELLQILPRHLAEPVDELGKEDLQELRLRLKAPAELVLSRERKFLRGYINRQDLAFVINAASRYSPWAAATVARGYLTAPGGHRIGICGEAIVRNGVFEGVREPESLCIRVTRDFPGIGQAAAKIGGSVLILGAPGWGKTTLLRDLIRIRSQGEHIAVADERGEVFPGEFPRGPGVDVMLGCPKTAAVEMLLKTMGPEVIALDEITSAEDARALIHCANCGVRLMATAHASSLEEFKRREIWWELLEKRVFDHVVVLRKDKTYRVERMGV